MATHEIKIQTGHVLGKESEGVLSFKGIPYAAPITELNRWLPPQPPLAFDGVLDASDYGQICPQDVSMPPSAFAARHSQTPLPDQEEPIRV